MFVVTVEFKVRPEFVAQFLPEMIANARATASTEPGCRQFDVCTDPQDQTRVFLYELYDDRAAFDAHLATPHFKEFDRKTGAWLVSKTASTLQRTFP